MFPAHINVVYFFQYTNPIGSQTTQPAGAVGDPTPSTSRNADPSDPESAVDMPNVTWSRRKPGPRAAPSAALGAPPDASGGDTK